MTFYLSSICSGSQTFSGNDKWSSMNRDGLFINQVPQFLQMFPFFFKTVYISHLDHIAILPLMHLFLKTQKRNPYSLLRRRPRIPSLQPQCPHPSTSHCPDSLPSFQLFPWFTWLPCQLPCQKLKENFSLLFSPAMSVSS